MYRCLNTKNFNKLWTTTEIFHVCQISRQLQSKTNERSIIGDRKIYNSVAQPINAGTKTEKEEFNSLFPNILSDLTAPYRNISDVQTHYVKILNRNVPNHKQSLGLITVTAYKAFVEHNDLVNKHNLYLVNILGWCVDLLLTSWKMVDDIMDSSKTRRGLPCWYRNDDVGISAINDTIFLERCVYVLLEKHFSKHKFYLSAIEWFHKMTVKVVIGQTMDTRYNSLTDLNAYTMSRYILACKYISSYPAFCLPVILAMNFAGKDSPDLHRKVIPILFEMGLYYRIQNDILDVYGDSLMSGKIGSDIKNGKCSWLIVRALEKATVSQRKILKRHFGKPDLDSVLETKLVYDNLNLFEEFLEYENKTFKRLVKRITHRTGDFPREFFLKLVGATFSRDIRNM